MKTAAFRL